MLAHPQIDTDASIVTSPAADRYAGAGCSTRRRVSRTHLLVGLVAASNLGPQPFTSRLVIAESIGDGAGQVRASFNRK